MDNATAYDSGGLEILSEEECLALLQSRPIGRIVFTDRALPAIQPVNFVLADGQVVIRTMAGSKLAAAARHTIVAFEADHYDAETRTGWSVVIIGHARQINGDRDLARLRALPLQPWAPGTRDRFITVTPEMISGRRIPHH